MAKNMQSNQIIILVATCVLVIVFFYHSACWMRNSNESFENANNAVMFFENCGENKGLYHTTKADAYNMFNVNSTPLANSSISALTVPPTAKVTLYDRRSSKGDSISLLPGDQSVADCLTAAGWNKRAKSVVVEPLVTVYPECEYSGAPKGFDVGFHILSDNVIFKSMRIPEGYGVALLDSITYDQNTRFKLLEGPYDVWCVDSLPYSSTRDWGSMTKAFNIARLAMFYDDTKYRKKIVSLEVDSTQPQVLPGSIRSFKIPPGYKALIYYNQESATKKEKPQAILTMSQQVVTIPKPPRVSPEEFKVFVVFDKNWAGDDTKSVDADLKEWKW